MTNEVLSALLTSFRRSQAAGADEVVKPDRLSGRCRHTGDLRVAPLSVTAWAVQLDFRALV